ncbi:filamentous hemagglutinin N-terminal domain-containing protein [Capilliphycus salinus ALCB114379]|uniref:two-partner secretion domain-containing protein n=1 Tax=Capilliphycus salinus TaxID=2768948 RepID=UPI0039A4F42B
MRLFNPINLVPLTLIFAATTATAQIIPDNSLGSENSVVTPNVNIRGIPSDRIDGGAVRGSNLFHSFEEFNVEEGRGAYFSNPDNIINILTRVTGGNISEILGTLGVLGNANLFLINPSGIVFGPNARLDVGGSFFASTADGILFENGFEFAASNPEAPPLLTINIPIGLNIRENPGTIVNQATLTTLEDGSSLRNDAGFLVPQGLNIPQNKTLALVGGDVLFNNGVAISPGSQIELGGLSEPGIIELANVGKNANTPILQFPNNIQRGNVALTNQSQINVRSNEGRDINIKARNFEMSGGSIIRAGFDQGLGVAEARGGDININAQENVLLADNSFISNIIDIDSFGEPGDINIETSSLLMENGAEISASTFGPGNSGSVSILATNSVELSNATIFSSAAVGAVGNGGTVEIITENLLLSNGSQVITDTSGEGNAGNITVQAKSIEITGSSPDDSEIISGFFADVMETGIGNGGTITIETEQLLLSDGARISSSTFGQGNAGLVSILATDSVELLGSSIISNVVEGGTGNANTVNIETRNLLVSGGSQIQSLTFGNGDAGNINIKAESIELTGTSADGLESSIITASSRSGEGNSGNIIIEAERLRITDGSGIIASATGRGNAGTIFIKATDIQLFGFAPNSTNPSFLSASVEEQGTGNSGNIIIETARLLLEDGGLIRVRNTANTPGNSGQVLIIASESVRLNNAVGINTDTVGPTNAAPITIFTRSLSIEGRSGIAANSGTPENPTETGQGGEISIFASEEVQLRGGNQTDETAIISSVTFGGGRAGKVRIETGQLVVDKGLISVLSNDTASGNAGNIEVFASDFVELSRVQSGLLAATDGVGNAGNITVETPELVLKDEASIGVGSLSGSGNAGNIRIESNQLFIQDEANVLAATTDGGGDAGNININSSESVEIRGRGSIIATTQGSGNAGNVRIETEQFQLRDGGSVNVDSTASGIPGNIDISANETLLNNQAQLNASSEAGQGGNIRLQSDDIRLLNESRIFASGSDSGQTFEGNVDIDTNLLVLLQQSRILTDAFNPTGGSNITIRPLGNSELGLLQSQDSIINAAGELSIDDTLNFDPPETPEVEFIDPRTLIAQDPCKQGQDSEFIITGRGGIAPNPTQALTSIEGLVELESPLIQPVTPQSNFSSEPPQQQSQNRENNSENNTVDSREIIPARGWIKNENGDIILVGYDPTQTGVQRQQYNPLSCQS